MATATPAVAAVPAKAPQVLPPGAVTITFCRAGDVPPFPGERLVRPVAVGEAKLADSDPQLYDELRTHGAFRVVRAKDIQAAGVQPRDIDLTDGFAFRPYLPMDIKPLTSPLPIPFFIEVRPAGWDPKKQTEHALAADKAFAAALPSVDSGLWRKDVLVRRHTRKSPTEPQMVVGDEWKRSVTEVYEPAMAVSVPVTLILHASVRLSGRICAIRSQTASSAATPEVVRVPRRFVTLGVVPPGAPVGKDWTKPSAPIAHSAEGLRTWIQRSDESEQTEVTKWRNTRAVLKAPTAAAAAAATAASTEVAAPAPAPAAVKRKVPGTETVTASATESTTVSHIPTLTLTAPVMATEPASKRQKVMNIATEATATASELQSVAVPAVPLLLQAVAGAAPRASDMDAEREEIESKAKALTTAMNGNVQRISDSVRVAREKLDKAKKAASAAKRAMGANLQTITDAFKLAAEKDNASPTSPVVLLPTGDAELDHGLELLHNTALRMINDETHRAQQHLDVKTPRGTMDTAAEHDEWHTKRLRLAKETHAAARETHAAVQELAKSLQKQFDAIRASTAVHPSHPPPPPLPSRPIVDYSDVTTQPIVVARA
jgi:hypothetical protein